MSVQESIDLPSFALNPSFNTSYVSVQATKREVLGLFVCCFNTSYVSVQAALNLNFKEVGEFQYILCVGSSAYDWREPKGLAVSIHPMCRFKGWR